MEEKGRKKGVYQLLKALDEGRDAEWSMSDCLIKIGGSI
jgi:hypothetical protein